MTFVNGFPIGTTTVAALAKTTKAAIAGNAWGGPAGRGAMVSEKPFMKAPGTPTATAPGTVITTEDPVQIKSIGMEEAFGATVSVLPVSVPTSTQLTNVFPTGVEKADSLPSKAPKLSGDAARAAGKAVNSREKDGA